MWGEVTPAERLRAVTRRHVDEDRLAAEAADALDTLGHAVREVWVIGGVGRILPARLYDVVRRETFGAHDLDDEPAIEELSLERVDCIAGPRGVQRAHDAAARSDCPDVPELLRPID